MKRTTIPYKQIHPSDVFVGFLIDGSLVNPPATGNEFIDVFVGLVRKYKRMPVKQYADAMGLDIHVFLPAVIALTGMGAHEWISEYMRLACCELLEKTDWSVSEIAKRAGFSSISTFSQFFYRVQKCQPYAFRKGYRYHSTDK